MTAILNQRSVDDIVAVLVSKDSPELDPWNILESSLTLCQTTLTHFGHHLTWEVLGVALVVHKCDDILWAGLNLTFLRKLDVLAARSDVPKRNPQRCQNLQNICSLVSCNTALKECKDAATLQICELSQSAFSMVARLIPNRYNMAPRRIVKLGSWIFRGFRQGMHVRRCVDADTIERPWR